MRGKGEQQLDVFSYVSSEQRVPQGPSLASSSVMPDVALRETMVPQAVRQNRATVDRAGEVVVSALAASDVLGAQRTVVALSAHPLRTSNSMDYYARRVLDTVDIVRGALFNANKRSSVWLMKTNRHSDSPDAQVDHFHED